MPRLRQSWSLAMQFEYILSSLPCTVEGIYFKIKEYTSAVYFLIVINLGCCCLIHGRLGCVFPNAFSSIYLSTYLSYRSFFSFRFFLGHPGASGIIWVYATTTTTTTTTIQLQTNNQQKTFSVSLQMDCTQRCGVACLQRGR